VNFGPDGTVFKAGKPATLTIPLDLSVLGGDTSAVRIYTRDAKGRIQEVLPASSYVFDLAAGTVSFPAAHFSSYQAFGVIAKIARGDLDGDGFADLVMPAPAAGTSGEGRIFIVRGGPVLSSRNTSAASFTIAGTGPGDALGHAFVVADVNGDGTDDLIAGVAGGTPRVVVYFGGPDFILTGLPDVTISRGAGDGATFAATLTAGDLNDDGVADVVVGDPGSSRGASQAGACFVFFGPVTAARNADAADVILTGTGTGDRFAISLAAGDVVTAGGDAGAHDLVVGADQADVAPAANGKVYVFRGPLAAGSASASTAQAVLVGDAAGSAFGLPVSVGDVDGGGMADIVAGAAGADTGPLTDPGKVFVFRGEGSIGTTAGDVPFATLSGRNAGDRAGRAFAVADFTGGNDAEVALGIPGDEAAATDSGSVAVWNGTTTGATDAAPGALPRIYGAASGRKLGSQYVAAADLNGDGHDDLIVGDPADATNGADAGAVFVFFGGGSPFPSGTSTTTANIVIRGAAGQKLGLVGP
jgi:hypothetical protein